MPATTDVVTGALRSGSIRLAEVTAVGFEELPGHATRWIVCVPDDAIDVDEPVYRALLAIAGRGGASSDAPPRPSGAGQRRSMTKTSVTILVRIAPAIGAMTAASGNRVGSVPVTISGTKIATSATAVQIATLRSA